MSLHSFSYSYPNKILKKEIFNYSSLFEHMI